VLRIESFKRERLAGTWKAHGQIGVPKPIQPGTVNRELDTLKALLAWAAFSTRREASYRCSTPPFEEGRPSVPEFAHQGPRM
jgi:hypothetical protein